MLISLIFDDDITENQVYHKIITTRMMICLENKARLLIGAKRMMIHLRTALNLKISPPYLRQNRHWRIEIAIIMPCAFTSGTSHFANAELPGDKEVDQAYSSGTDKGLADEIRQGFSEAVPEDADVDTVADAIVKVVNIPFGTRPFRTHRDPETKW